MSDEIKIRNEINDYEQTIHAIVGFINFFLYDAERKEMRRDVIVLQGRRFNPSPGKSFNRDGERIDYVTPDIGILLPSKGGVIGEVKKSFPSDQKHWFKIFEQLMRYDDDLTGWPTDDETVDSHDIVLILHQSRGARVREFYETQKGTKIDFNRPFSIIEFNRSDEEKSYYFFRKLSGKLSEESVDSRLLYGVPVPMEVFIKIYSTIKIYDDEPPPPYLLHLIWQNVALKKAAESEHFEKLRRNQKIDVNLEMETIIDELHRGFSFRGLNEIESNRQPRIPKREWILRACDKLVELKEAKWVDQRKTITIFFRPYDDVLSHFIKCCAGDVQEDIQPKLFKDEEFE